MRALRRALSVVACVCLLGTMAHADDKPRAPGTVAATVPALKPARPYWLELTVAQREALTPLADDWERLDFQTKKKWVEISNRYPRMSPEEQGRNQERMREWAMLTPEQRRTARDSFARVRAMNPEQRADMLRKYQELPSEKKRELATEGRANKALVPTRQVPPAPARKGQIREGASTRNAAVAAQKGASTLVAPARPSAVPYPAAPVAP